MMPLRLPRFPFWITLLLPIMSTSRGAMQSTTTPGSGNEPISSDLLAEERRSPPCENATLDLASQFIAARQLDFALDTLRRAAPSCSGTGRYHALLAAVLLKKGASVQAAQEYYSAIDLSPHQSEYYRALAEILIQHRAYGNARVLLVSANHEFPDQVWTYLMLAEVYRTYGSFNEAKSVLDRALRRWPDDATARVLLGNVLAGTAPLDALAQYKKALQLAPGVPQAHLFYGIALEKLNRTSEAIAALTQCVALDPKVANAHYYLGQIYLKQSKISASVSELTTALQLDPAYALAYFQLGTAYRKAGDKAKAEACLRRFGELSKEQKSQEVKAGEIFSEALARPSH